ITQIIGQKLAAIAARTVAERPDLVEVSRLATELSERLSNEAILEMLEAIRDFGRSDKGGPVLAGDLAVVPIGAILQLLQGEKQSGVLVCTSGDLEVRTTFRAGAIDLVEASGLSHEFRLGRFFVEEGVVTPAEIDEILKPGGRLLGKVPVVEGNVRIDAAERLGGDEAEAPYSTVQMKEKQTTSSVGARGLGELPDVELVAELVATPKRRPLGMALLAAGKIVPLQLKTALTRQSSELLYEVLRWPSGRFELRREPPSELAEGAKLGLPVASVVMEGFRRVDEWRVLERTIGSFDAVLVRDDSAFGKLDVTSLPLKEKAVLDAVDGERTVREIVMESHLSSFDACRILVQLLEARALRRRAG
ncbi:MAG TPA: DUF4388 domain-containing protein, partial [Labilithrix sp.]|nr:DUF4388 domain-containing protein [Labilithrix sp.]